MEEGKLRQRRILKEEKADDRIEGQYRSNKTYAINSVPNYVGFTVLFVFLFFLRFFYLYENYFPPQLTIKDAKSHPGEFIGERAEMQLKRLTDLGTRVVGSYENEVLAVDFLKREISFIAQGASKVHKIEIDVQRPTGSYYLLLRPYGFRNYYANIQNIVVKLSSTNATESVLINCHYDTVPESPGASDNGLNCAVMLEILRVLSSSDTPLKNNLIFLFNGAEENPLQASHGFSSQHKWSKEVKVFINLDSAGSGGKEILFQTTGEPWLIKTYGKSVPRPSAAVQAEEMFQNGLIPSDTDFRIFRQFGNYSGLDFAHCFNGYVYHTKHDTMNFINPGVYQFTGENMLALTKALVQTSEMGKIHEKTTIVYFDVFQLFLVSYSGTISLVINLATVILSLWTVFRTFKCLQSPSDSLPKSIFLSTGGSLMALLLPAAVAFVIAKTLDLCKSTLSWHLKPWLIVPIYVFPIALSMSAIFLLTTLTFLKRGPIDRNVVRLVNGGKILWTIILLIGTLKEIRSAFSLMLMILPISLITLPVTRSKRTFSVKTYLLANLAGLVFPILLKLYQTVKIITVIIPMAARMGPQINPEVVIMALTFVLTTPYFSYIVPLLLLLKKPKTFLVFLSVIHVLAMIGVTCTHYGFPYDGNVRNPAIQRFYVLHCERTFYDAKGSVRRSDSGFFVQGLDRNNLNYLSEVIGELKNAPAISQDCKSELYCGFPVFTSRFILPATYSVRIPAAPPTIHHPTSLELVNQTQISVNVRKMRILVTGPDHITIVLSPRKNVSLIKWSFDEFEPKESQNWNDRPTYMIYYSHGLMGGTIDFDVHLMIDRNQSDPVLDVAVVGHYMHEKKFRTEEFKKFISRFPKWAHVTPWITTYKSWVL